MSDIRINQPTSCSKIFAAYQKAHSEIFERFKRDTEVARKREFPVGTPVEWEHGRRDVRGVVIELPKWDEEVVMVKRNGAKHPIRKKARELKPLNE